MDIIPKVVNIWMEFQGNTLFGKKNHKGIIVAVNPTEKIGIAIAVTSNWEGRDNARINAGDPKESIVWIPAKDKKASGLFPKNSVIDCGSVEEFSFEKMLNWLKNEEVFPIGYNEVVKQELITEIKTGILSSNRVSDLHKDMLKQ